MLEEKLTENQNFKVSATLQRAIEQDASELGLSTSAYLRLCVYLAGPVLLECPALADLDRQRLADLGTTIGKTLVIRPASVAIVHGG